MLVSEPIGVRQLRILLLLRDRDSISIKLESKIYEAIRGLARKGLVDYKIKGRMIEIKRTFREIRYIKKVGRSFYRVVVLI